MKKLLLCLCLIAFGLQAQHIAPGDPCFTGAQLWPSPSMEWNPTFQCAVPLPAGDYQITFGMQEPTVTATGQRAFSILINGATVLTNIDLYAMAKTAPVTMMQRLFLPAAGTVTFLFKASIRNAVVSYIDIAPVATAGTVFITSPTHVTGAPCPVGWTGHTLVDGTCMVIYFSQEAPQ